MAKPRLKPSGKWEIGLRHPSLPNGRKYFTFDTEAEAIAYGQQWKLMKHADIPPPAELTAPTSPGDGVRLLRMNGQYVNKDIVTLGGSDWMVFSMSYGGYAFLK